MMDKIAKTGKRFIIHPHDQSLMDYIEGEYLARGENTPQAYASAYASRNGVIWDTAIEVVLRLAEASGCPVHLAHMQTRRSVEAVRRAKDRGVDVTCEVNHWLPFLSTWEDVERLGPYALSYWVPDEGRDAIWEGMARRHDRHAAPPTMRRTPARRRRSAGPQMWAATPARPASSTTTPCCWMR